MYGLDGRCTNMTDLSVAEEMMRRADPAALLGTLAPLAVAEVAMIGGCGADPSRPPHPATGVCG